MTEKSRKIQELYPEAIPVKSTDSLAVISKKAVPNQVYNIEEYMGMKDLESFIENVIVGAQMASNSEKKTVRLTNKDNFYQYVNAPVYYVNGYLAGNETAILQIPLSQMKTVEIYNTKASITSGFPEFMLGMGIISVTTRKNTVPKSISDTFNNLTLIGISEPAKNYNLTKPVAENKPVFRSVVYGENGLQSDKTGNATLSFYPVSSLGEYLIAVDYLEKDGRLFREITTINIVR